MVDQLPISAKKLVVILSVLGLIITSVSLLATSFGQVDFNEYALLQHRLNKQIQNRVYEEGFYTIGFWHEFLPS